MIKNKPTVLLLVEGLGISASKSGNAFLSANPANFFRLWNNYGHTLIEPNISSDQSLDLYRDVSSDFGSFSVGQYIFHDQQFITDSIANGSFYGNQIIGQAYEVIIHNNSALHLIGNLGDKNGRFGNISHLMALIRWAKHRRIFRVNIHLIIDDKNFSDLSEVLEAINHLEKEISKIECGEIASITGQSFVTKKNILKSLSSIVMGEGKASLSANQAIVLQSKRKNAVSDFIPTAILFRGKPIGKFNAFDCALFFNHDCSNLENLIYTICSKNNKIVPRFITAIALFNNLVNKPESLKIAVTRFFSNTIPELLSASDKSLLWIGQENSKRNFNYFCGNYRSELIKSKIIRENNNNELFSANFFNELFVDLGSEVNENDLIVIDCPSLKKSLEEKSFNQTLEEVRVFDNALHQIANYIIEAGGNLIISSVFGGIEQFNNADPYFKINKKSKNPLPFILVSPMSKTTSASGGGINDRLLYDIIGARHKFISAQPTIVRLLGLKEQPSLRGESFLDELINHS